MATVTRPAGAYTPANPITNSTKYQDDSASNVFASSAKVDGDINKAYDTLSNHDDSIVDHEARIDALEGAGTVTEFADNVFRVKGSSDATKKVAFEVDGLTTATTRTKTLQDVSGTIYESGGTDVAIADGGTGASTKTAAFDALAPTTTKGDIPVFNGTNNVRIGVGTNGQVIVADSTQSTGLKYANSPEWIKSSEQTITTSSTIVVNHSLGTFPNDVQVVLKNKTTQYNWAVDDEVILAGHSINYNHGFSIGMNSTSIYVCVAPQIWVYDRNNPTNWNAITTGNWRIVVKWR